MHASGETRGVAGEERLREALVAKPVGGGVIRGPDKNSMQPPLAAQLPARPEEALPGAQAAAGGVRPEADKHLPPLRWRRRTGRSARHSGPGTPAPWCWTGTRRTGS